MAIILFYEYAQKEFHWAFVHNNNEHWTIEETEDKIITIVLINIIQMKDTSPEEEIKKYVNT